MKKSRVVIIGAGPAGITAAYQLMKEKKYNVILLEASDEIGGISKTVTYNGNRMDIGGHRFFSKDERIMDLWKEVMPIQGKDAYDDKVLKRKKTLSVGGPDPEKEDNVMLVRKRISRIYYMNKFFDYPISFKLQTFKNMGIINTFKVGFSYIKASIFKREENSLEDFYINHFGKKLYSMFFERYTEKLWGRHPKEISADWGAQRVNGISIKSIIKDMFNKLFGRKNKDNTQKSLIEEYWYPKYGPGQLWENMVNDLVKKGMVLKKNSSVEKIVFKEGKIDSVICNTGGTKEVIKGDIFLSSMPLNDLVNSFETDVPKNIKNIVNGLPFVDFMTAGIIVKELKLKNETDIKTFNDSIPDCWVYVQDPRVKMLRFQIFNNWSPYMVKDVKHTISLGLEYTCKENDEYWNMKDGDFVDMAIDELVLMGIIDKSSVIDSHVERVKKAYPAYFDTYKYIHKVINYLNKIDNLYCIGRNGQHRYNNMDHSMLTAIEAVDVINNNKKNKADIWKVNTEKEYHENKN